MFYFATGTFSLVREYVDEATPAYIGNRSGQPAVPDHPLDVQAFHSDFAVARNQFIGNFVLMLASQISYPSMNASNAALGLLAIIAAVLLATNRPLSAAQCWKLFLEKPGIGDLLAIGKRSEVRQPEIEPDSRQQVPNLGWLRQLAGQYHEPLVSLALDRECLDCSFDFAVQANADRPDMLNAQLVNLETDTVAVAREQNRVEPIGGFKAWVTGLLTGLHTPKEISKRFVEAAQRGLSAGKVNVRKPEIVLALILEPTGLILVVARDLPLIVKPAALCQSRIVESAVRLKGDLKLALLIGVGPESEFISFEHNSFSLRFDIFTHTRFADVPDSSSKITAARYGLKRLLMSATDRVG